MSPKRIDELVVAAARAEPMMLEERARLDAALDGSSELRADWRAQQGLTAELAGLGASLRATRSQRDAEPALRTAFSLGPRASARFRRRVAPIAAVAGAAAAVAALAWLGASQEPDAEIGPSALPAAATNVTAGFQPLMYAPNPSPSRAYSVVRVEIPVSALALQYAGDFDGTIQADILIGEDGLPAGIRFAPSDGVLAQTISQ